jgi:uncharacterized protein (TIGR03085 family)
MSSEPNPAQLERAALSDLFVEVGPDAPTLCSGWTTRDLAAHLVMRERRPDGALGIVVSKAAGHADKVQAQIAAQPWSELVDKVRSGPPRWSPTSIGAIDRAANTAEFYVHHEDVRRAAGSWEPRRLDPVLERALTELLTGRMTSRLVRHSPVGIVLEPTEDLPVIVVKDAEPSVTVRGPVGELVLFVFGRQQHTRIEARGDEGAVDAAMHASFGI